MLKVYRPILTNRLTQRFGENRACAKIGADMKPIRPFRIVTKKRGARFCPDDTTPFYKALGLRGHNGWDMAAWHGEPCYFPVDTSENDIEWYAKNERDKDGGIGVDIISRDAIYLDALPYQTQHMERYRNGNGWRVYVKFRFWHLRESAVYDGQTVKLGDLIGYCDSTGASSGDHLHWSMKFVDENGKTINKWNGYYGAVDFEQFYENRFVGDIVKIKKTQKRMIDILRQTVFVLKQLLELKNEGKS